MINYTKKADIKSLILEEKKRIKLFNSFQKKLKQSLHSYIDEFKTIDFDNDIIKNMFLNNLSNGIVQADNNLSNIQSLSNILDILENQDTISKEDIETYNKLFANVEQDMKVLQNFLSQTISNCENVPTAKDSLSALSKFKSAILKDISDVEATKEIEASISSKSIKKKIDATSSDLLCFFPKKASDNLVISTSQENYKISFEKDIAKIYIENENFNISLKTSGIQVMNSVTNTVLFVTYIDDKYIVITNSQLEMPQFIPISRISKNDDFLKVELTSSSLNLDIENSIINFKNITEYQNVVTAPHLNSDSIVQNIKSEEGTKTNRNLYSEITDTPVSNIVNTPKVAAKSQVKEEFIPTSQNENTDEDILKDNDTLIISDSSKNVILPYKIEDLEEKLKSNKKYRSLEEVIQKEYTIPIETFKNPTKSRFKEAFQLIKKKEHGSLKEAIELGFELMFESDLNPAVIAACRDLDELDIYLDCLDDNELDKFSCFKIQYDIPPTKKPKKGKH